MQPGEAKRKSAYHLLLLGSCADETAGALGKNLVFPRPALELPMPLPLQFCRSGSLRSAFARTGQTAPFAGLKLIQSIPQHTGQTRIPSQSNGSATGRRRAACITSYNRHEAILKMATTIRTATPAMFLRFCLHSRSGRTMSARPDAVVATEADLLRDGFGQRHTSGASSPTSKAGRPASPSISSTTPPGLAAPASISRTSSSIPSFAAWGFGKALCSG